MTDLKKNAAPDPTMKVLAVVDSGRIDMVWNGAFSRVEFNCSCLDALPYCKGMCCRLRAGYSIELEEDEIALFENKEHPTRKGVRILKSKEDGLNCYYLTKEGLCSIHERKPRMCRRWHCSPGGERDDNTIERRDAGWLLMPLRREEVDLIDQQLVGG